MVFFWFLWTVSRCTFQLCRVHSAHWRTCWWLEDWFVLFMEKHIMNSLRSIELRSLQSHRDDETYHEKHIADAGNAAMPHHLETPPSRTTEDTIVGHERSWIPLKAYLAFPQQQYLNMGSRGQPHQSLKLMIFYGAKCCHCTTAAPTDYDPSPLPFNVSVGPKYRVPHQ